MVATSDGTSWAAAVEGFLAFSSVERGLAPRTVEAYAHDLSRFVAHHIHGKCDRYLQ